MLNPVGYLAIADVYPEDGSFYGDELTGHKGFDIDILSNQTGKQGFSNINSRKCFVLDRKISDIKTKQFDVFLLIIKRDIIQYQ